MVPRYLFLPLVFLLTAVIAWWSAGVHPEESRLHSSLDLPEIMLPLSVTEARADTLSRQPASPLPDLEIVPLSE